MHTFFTRIKEHGSFFSGLPLYRYITVIREVCNEFRDTVASHNSLKQELTRTNIPTIITYTNSQRPYPYRGVCVNQNSKLSYFVIRTTTHKLHDLCGRIGCRFADIPCGLRDVVCLRIVVSWMKMYFRTAVKNDSKFSGRLYHCVYNNPFAL